MRILVTDLDGVEHPIDGKLNWTVMEVIRDADLPMRAECGGSCACATCHVTIDPAWTQKLPAMTVEERDTLDGGADVQPTSRLSCQLAMTTELEGLKVTLTKDSAG